MRCPVCKADNETPPACRRCKADLSLLFSLESQRHNALQRARQALEVGQVHEAVVLASRAEALRGGGDARRLLALASLRLGDHARAWRLFLRDRKSANNG